MPANTAEVIAVSFFTGLVDTRDAIAAGVVPSFFAVTVATGTADDCLSGSSIGATFSAPTVVPDGVGN
jgi:hypothetical protein